ncbi:MAG: hypothetical protein WC869_01870 [Phycisphaerae bacterium]|jgi:hypothetical protein
MTSAPRPDLPDGLAIGEVLAHLESLLVQQLEAARHGDFVRALELMKQAGELSLPGGQENPRPDQARLERIGKLERELRLLLADQKDRLAGELSRLSSQKKVARSYGLGSGRF